MTKQEYKDTVNDLEKLLNIAARKGAFEIDMFPVVWNVLAKFKHHNPCGCKEAISDVKELSKDKKKEPAENGKE